MQVGPLRNGVLSHQEGEQLSAITSLHYLRSLNFEPNNFTYQWSSVMKHLRKYAAVNTSQNMCECCVLLNYNTGKEGCDHVVIAVILEDGLEVQDVLHLSFMKMGEIRCTNRTIEADGF